MVRLKIKIIESTMKRYSGKFTVEIFRWKKRRAAWPPLVPLAVISFDCRLDPKSSLWLVLTMASCLSCLPLHPLQIL